MNDYISMPAIYKRTGVRRFDGNPFIEALPSMEKTKDSILDRLINYPDPPTKADRRKSEMVRLAEAGVVSSIVYPFAEYKRAGTNLTINLREPYVARNPITIEDKQRRAAIALQESQGVPFPSNWNSSAKGQSLLGISGSGKTTFAESFALPYLVVIEHTEYNGIPLKCRQIPWVTLRVPHDATLKSLCLQFFERIDSILGNTNYLREARGARSVSQMVMLMAKVATAVSLGVIFVDEVQNLRSARGTQAEVMLNLFSEIIEKAGVSLVIAGTPAVEDVIDKNVRNLRKLNSGGESRFSLMKLGDPEFDAFCDKYWEYQYVGKPRRLTPEIRKAWHRSGAGNPAFTAMAFMLAQRTEIGGREQIDEVSFERVSKKDMAILEPAISALRSGKSARLREFDDLLFKEGCRSLLDMIGWTVPSKPKDGIGDEFDDLPEEKHAAEPRKKKLRRGLAKAMAPVDLPTENPLIM